MESSKLPPPPPMSSSALKAGPPPMNLKPGNHDRGWNDPPVFPVEINAVVKSAPTKLNKRVPFPGLTSSSPPPPGAGMLNPSALLPTTTAITPASGNINMDDGGSSGNMNSFLDQGPTTVGFKSSAMPSTNVEFIPTLPTPAPPGANKDQGYPAHEGNNNADASAIDLSSLS